MIQIHTISARNTALTSYPTTVVLNSCNYLTSNSASNIFDTISARNTTLASYPTTTQMNTALTSYLTSATASTTYLSQTLASSIYLAQAGGNINGTMTINGVFNSSKYNIRKWWKNKFL